MQKEIILFPALIIAKSKENTKTWSNWFAIHVFYVYLQADKLTLD